MYIRPAISLKFRNIFVGDVRVMNAKFYAVVYLPLCTMIRPSQCEAKCHFGSSYHIFMEILAIRPLSQVAEAGTNHSCAAKPDAPRETI